jgi:DNA repair protein RadC
MAISRWSTGEGPRDKLLRRGVEALSDVELLAVLMRTGRRGMGVLDCARAVLERFGSLGRLLASPVGELQACPGIGRARSAELKAVLELARRAMDGRMRDENALTAPGAVRDYLRLTLMEREREVFAVVFLDAQNRVIAFEELFHGTLTQTSVYPREVVRSALRHNAAAAIFAHNHPSGVAEPSAADRALTRALTEALGLVEVRVLDHFIVGRGCAMSFAERGML